MSKVLSSLCDSGHETKAMMNNSGPRYKRSYLEKRLNTDVLWCVLLLIVMCLTAAIGVHQHPHLHSAAAELWKSTYWHGMTWIQPVNLLLLVFFRSWPLAEQPQRSSLWDWWRHVTCLGRLPCLLDHDHCAAGGFLTIPFLISCMQRFMTTFPSRENQRTWIKV